MGVLGVSMSVKVLLPEINRAYSDAVPLGGIPSKNSVEFPQVMSPYAGANWSDFGNVKIFANFC
jgi:hypothetical protein